MPNFRRCGCHVVRDVRCRGRSGEASERCVCVEREKGGLVLQNSRGEPIVGRAYSFTLACTNSPSGGHTRTKVSTALALNSFPVRSVSIGMGPNEPCSPSNCTLTCTPSPQPPRVASVSVVVSVLWSLWSHSTLELWISLGTNRQMRALRHLMHAIGVRQNSFGLPQKLDNRGRLGFRVLCGPPNSPCSNKTRFLLMLRSRSHTSRRTHKPQPPSPKTKPKVWGFAPAHPCPRRTWTQW